MLKAGKHSKYHSHQYIVQVGTTRLPYKGGSAPCLMGVFLHPTPQGELCLCH